MSNIETLNAKREEAKRIVNSILEDSKIIENNVSTSKALLKDITVKSKEVKKLNSTLNRIITTTDAAIGKFREERNNVSKLLTQVDNFYQKKYLPLSNKILDKETGLDAKIKKSKSAEVEILKLKENSINQFNEVKNYAEELKKTNRELRSIDNSIRKLLNDSTTKNQKINELTKSANALENKIKKILADIDNLHEKGKEKIDQISIFFKNAETELESIKEIKEKSTDLLQKIQDIYEIAADTGLAGEFDKRQKKLNELSSKWEIRIFWTLIFLFMLIISIFVAQLKLVNWDLSINTFDINFYIRFLIISPVIYYLSFCSMQYARTKRLHDKYSFKTTLAMSITSHIQLLTQQEHFKNDDNMIKILDFVLDGFKKIYTEPHSDDDYKLKLKLMNMELEIEKKIMNTISKTLGLKQVSEK